MISLKRKETGFTIVELLIVIVVIGILAALVITTFSGIQRKARDSERQTDINALHGQVEAYFAQNGEYPTLANMQSDAFITGTLKGLDVNAARDPKGQNANDVVASPTANRYAYAVTPANCDNSDGNECTAYVLTATNENGTAPNNVYTKSSLN